MKKSLIIFTIFVLAWYIATGFVITYFDKPDNFFLQLNENLLNCNHIIAFILGVIFSLCSIKFGNWLYKILNKNGSKNS